MALAEQQRQLDDPATKVIEFPIMEVENEIAARTGVATGTWRGEEITRDAYSFAGEVDFALDGGYTVDALRGREFFRPARRYPRYTSRSGR